MDVLRIKHLIAPLALGLLVQFTPLLAGAVEDKLQQIQPVDEADRDPTLERYRERLLTAVRHHEPERLVELVDLNIYNGPNQAPGAQQFAEIWQIDAFDSPSWETFKRVFSLGGGFVRSEKGVQFCSPYVFTEFPENLNILTHAAVIRPTADLMSEPSSGSEVIAKLSYHLLKIESWNAVPDMNGTEGLTWLKVVTLDGQEGFLQRDDVYGPAEHSACFLQDGRGGWKMVSFFSQLNSAQTP